LERKGAAAKKQNGSQNVGKVHTQVGQYSILSRQLVNEAKANE